MFKKLSILTTSTRKTDLGPSTFQCGNVEPLRGWRLFLVFLKGCWG